MPLGARFCYGLVVGPDAPISTLPTTPQNQPTVAASGDRVVAAWQYSGVGFDKVAWGYSLDGGQSWVEGAPLSLLSNDHRLRGHPSICVDDQGRFFLGMLYDGFDGITVAVYRAEPGAGAPAWLGPALILAGESYDAPQLACDPALGILYLTYTRTVNVDLLTAQTTVHQVRSTDRGLTWSAPQALSSAAANGGHAAIGPDGEVYVVWEDFALQQVVGRKSLDLGVSFGPAFVVGAMRDNLGASPPGHSGTGGRRNPVYPCGNLYAPAFPSIAVDRTTSSRRGKVYVTWSEYAEGIPTPPNGTYVSAIDPNDHFATASPVAFGETIYGDLLSHSAPADPREILTFEGTAGTTVWIEGEIYDLFNAGYDCFRFELLCGPDTLSLQRVAQTRIEGPYTRILPALIFTLPRTGRYYLRSNQPGSIVSYFYYLTLRTLEISPTSTARDHRDVVLVSSGDGGATWSQKVRVNDDPPRFDNALPEVAVDGFGQVHVAWYDRRDDSTCGALAHTYWAHSWDGGASFAASVRLSSQPGTWHFTSEQISSVGDHLALATSGDRLHVLWTQQGRPDWDIFGAGVVLDDPTGIAVSGFRAEPHGRGVRLRWTVSDAAGLLGFRLERAEGEGGAFLPLGEDLRRLVGPGVYEEEDRSVEPGRAYRYRLEVVRSDGTSAWQGPVSVALPARIGRLSWVLLSPNPFATSLRLELASPAAGEAAVAVYDLVGQEVAVLHRGYLGEGSTTFTWDGRDRSGRALPAGIYWLRARQRNEMATRTIIRME